MTGTTRAALNRRDLMVSAAAGGLALAAGSAVAAPAQVSIDEITKEAEVACLYHCDYGDHDRFAQTLNNIGNHYSAYGSAIRPTVPIRRPRDHADRARRRHQVLP